MSRPDHDDDRVIARLRSSAGIETRIAITTRILPDGTPRRSLTIACAFPGGPPRWVSLPAHYAKHLRVAIDEIEAQLAADDAARRSR